MNDRGQTRKGSQRWNNDPSYADVEVHQHANLIRRLWDEKRNLDEGGWGLPDRMLQRIVALLDEAGLVIFNGAKRRIRFSGRPESTYGKR